MWKFRVDSEISQKDRKLQENRKTIDTQRKAIQELQVNNLWVVHLCYFLFVFFVCFTKDRIINYVCCSLQMKL